MSTAASVQRLCFAHASPVLKVEPVNEAHRDDRQHQNASVGKCRLPQFAISAHVQSTATCTEKSMP